MKSVLQDHELGKIKAGDKYNYLTAVQYYEITIDGRGCRTPKWIFRCDCGEEVIAWVNIIKKGLKKSCGCKNPRRRKERKRIMPEITFVDTQKFTLADGQHFKHLFEWSYIPDLKDFQKLFFYCPGMAGADYLMQD